VGVVGYSVVYMGNSEYDNSKMDMLVERYPIVNMGWKYVGGGDTIRWSLGDVVRNMYMGNKVIVSNNGTVFLNSNKDGMTPMDIVNEGYINGAVMRRGYDSVYSYFIRRVEYSRMFSENGGQEYYIKHHNEVTELLSDPWGRRFIKYMGIVRNDMVDKYSDVYEGLSIQSNYNKGGSSNVVCSVDVTSIEGHRVYCLHLYS
jgi:hypothetical protein